MNPGVKNDQGKRQWWLFGNILQPMQEVIDILALGDKKYPSPDGANWRRVPDAKRRYSSAVQRHYFDGWLMGETHDPETGKHHLAHAISNMLFLLWFEFNGYPEDVPKKTILDHITDKPMHIQH